MAVLLGELQCWCQGHDRVRLDAFGNQVSAVGTLSRIRTRELGVYSDKIVRLLPVAGIFRYCADEKVDGERLDDGFDRNSEMREPLEW